MWTSDIIIGLAIINGVCFCWAFLMWTIKGQESVMKLTFHGIFSKEMKLAFNIRELNFILFESCRFFYFFEN